MSQPTDLQLTSAMHNIRLFTMPNDDGTRTVKPGLEMLAADAGAELCRLRELRTTWCGAGELQIRMVCDKLIAACGLTPNVEVS